MHSFETNIFSLFYNDMSNVAIVGIQAQYLYITQILVVVLILVFKILLQVTLKSKENYI